MKVKYQWLLQIIFISLTSVAFANQDRDPVYEYARKAGLVGEKPNGYLDFLEPVNDEIRRTIQEINIKRKALYTERAVANHISVLRYSSTVGCMTILKTEIGEKYMSPQGVWLTRTSSPPEREAFCVGVKN